MEWIYFNINVLLISQSPRRMRQNSTAAFILNSVRTKVLIKVWKFVINLEKYKRIVSPWVNQDRAMRNRSLQHHQPDKGGCFSHLVAEAETPFTLLQDTEPSKWFWSCCFNVRKSHVVAVNDAEMLSFLHLVSVSLLAREKQNNGVT